MATYLDLAKANDTIRHEQLVNKLETIRIQETAQQWFRSYLTVRTQRTKIGSTCNQKATIHCGILQGTILSALLFNIYANDIISLSLDSTIIAHADDTVLVTITNTWEETYEIAAMDLKTIHNHLEYHWLTLNTKKTTYTTYKATSNEKLQIQSIHMKIHRCQRARERYQCDDSSKNKIQKYSGIIIDEQLKWKEHIELTVKKLRKLMHPLYNLSQIVETQPMKAVYFALAHSII
ncbi:uncharacterized protein LOC124178370 [Neodiprion fabricii]|uniref:uncharacterized protein LOC124178370 n=1 Tax=Neodiprion fabricii TaxID=2872261 RepID=UPI001ED8C249|nr:uncharacterized protein LOC124178370 [Neodiprion fabricii]